MTRRRAMTLVEVVIGAVVGALILAFLGNLLSQGLRSSVKGASHLTNIQAGALLLAHCEADLQRARTVNVGSGGMHLEVVEEVGAGGVVCAAVSYELVPGGLGVRRRQSGGGPGDSDRVLASGLLVTPVGGQAIFTRTTLAEGRFGVLVRFEIATDQGKETNRLERFIFCGNAPANAAVPEWQRP
ncbi:MAG: hypothetical protein GX442_08415 [Candidatus Riflebacteria bacterium]|nr:hypothetical protein [Candidatus Riflebacteria bacterium]